MESGIKPSSFSADEIIRHISRSFGRKVHTVLPIAHGVANENFVVQADDDKYICKVYVQKTAGEIAFELQILEELSKHSFPCPRILKNKEGGSISYLNTRPTILYKYIQRETLKDPTALQMGEIGEKLGEIHSFLRDFSPSMIRKTWDPDDLSILIREHGKELVSKNVPNAAEILEFLAVELPKYSFPKDLPRGITHQDMKPENVIMNGGVITGVIDFDNSYRGAFLFDLATTIIWTCFKKGKLNEGMLDALLEGYGRVRPLVDLERMNLARAIKWRLLREIFIGPYAAGIGHEKTTAERSTYFMKLYKML